MPQDVSLNQLLSLILTGTLAGPKGMQTYTETTGEEPDSVMYNPVMGFNQREISDREAVQNVAGEDIPMYPKAFALGKVLEHPELYKYYPELKNTRVTQIPDSLANEWGMGQAGSAYLHNYSRGEDGDSVDVLMVPEKSSERFTTDRLLHETQHGIQGIEGVSFDKYKRPGMTPVGKILDFAGQGIPSAIKKARYLNQPVEKEAFNIQGRYLDPETPLYFKPQEPKQAEKSKAYSEFLKRSNDAAEPTTQPR